MKLKDSIVVDSVCGEYVAVPTGKSRCLFSGMIRNNEIALLPSISTHSILSRVFAIGTRSADGE